MNKPDALEEFSRAMGSLAARLSDYERGFVDGETRERKYPSEPLEEVFGVKIGDYTKGFEAGRAYVRNKAGDESSTYSDN